MGPQPTVEALLGKLMVEKEVEIPIERVKDKKDVYKICNRVNTHAINLHHRTRTHMALKPNLEPHCVFARTHG
jgi:hypothetical protein